MTNWETGPTAYAGPVSLVPPLPVPSSRTEPDPLRGAGGLLWLDVLDATIRTSAAHGRTEMAEWLSRRRAQLLHPQLRVLVVGGAQQGKSQLINALINAGVCGVDNGGTAVPTVVRHAESPGAELVRRGAADADWTAEVGRQDRLPLGLETLGASIMESTARLPAGTPVHAEVSVPRALLAGGLVLIDTPPLPGPDEHAPTPVPGTGARAVHGPLTHGTTTINSVIPTLGVGGPGNLGGAGSASAGNAGTGSAGGVGGVGAGSTGGVGAGGVGSTGGVGAGSAGGVGAGNTGGAGAGSAGSAGGVAGLTDLATCAGADLVVYVCEGERGLRDDELVLLRGLSRVYPGLLVVFSKTDYAVDWRRNLAEGRARLAREGVPAATTAVSSALRLHALRSGDAALNGESGFPELVVYLQRMVAAKSGELARKTVGRLSGIVLQELAVPLRKELTEQRDAGVPEAVARLHATQRRLDDLRKCAVRWQNTLSDEIGDLMSDIEHDLRERTRAVLAGAEEYFATADPAKSWDEFEPWLRQSLQELAETSTNWLAERTAWTAQRVAGQFPAEAGEVLPPPALVAAEDALDDTVPGLGAPPVARFSPGQKLFIGLRGSYGGVVVFGLMTSLAGMSMINPISVSGGAIFGGKTIRDESRSLLKKRQADAKVLVGRHVDDVFARLNKEARDTVRRAQRALRDHFTAVTEDLQESIMDSLRNAKAAADQDAAAREQRLRRVQQELAALTELHTQAQAL
ncbi:dynamin family protein [Actinoplanes sp. NPDC051851]|uniref:dynamin family protein n=1 Tax=Actinoplanes sp. NPDC051851 TaxID=3154753 RepID=UPI0034285335